MKKISVLLLIVIVFNFIFSNIHISYAVDAIDGQEAIYNKESFDKLTDEGVVNLNGSDEKLSVSTSSAGSVSGITASIFTPIAGIFSCMMSMVANEGGFYRTESVYGASENGWFTICSLVFGEYLLFDGKIYQTTKSLMPDGDSTDIMDLMDGIKENAAAWLKIVMRVALGIFLVLLMYAASKIFTSTTSGDLARWKKITLTWAIALAFVFFVPTIIAIIDTISELFMEILWNVRMKLEETGYSSFEVTIITTSISNLTNFGGIKAFAYALEYTGFVILQLIFFAKYFVRSFKLILLAVISPVIAVIHTFYKISGKDQNVLKEWFAQYILNVAIQPMHALIYIIFMFTASEIAINAPLLGLVFLWVLIRVEKIVKLMLNISDGRKMSLLGKKR